MRGALLVVVLLVRAAAADTPGDKVNELAGGHVDKPTTTSCDPVEAAELRAHLEREQRLTRKWNLIWGVSFGVASAGSLAVAIWNPNPDLEVGLYVSAGKAGIGALSRLVIPVRIEVPAASADACTDVTELRKALAVAAKRERGNFFLNHAGGILVNGAGAAIIWKYGTLGQAVLSVAIGYPIGLISNYTNPRNSWHKYRERTWTVTALPQRDGWAFGVAGSF